METIKIKNSIYQKIPSEKIFSELPKFLDKRFDVDCSTLHWSAGNYDQVFPDYQILVMKGSYIYVASQDFSDWIKHQHTWRRNSHNIAVSFMAMLNKYDFSVTDEMTESAAKIWAVTKHIYDLPWGTFKDHAYYSDLDKYGNQSKWDCRTVYLENGKLISLYEKTLKSAKWYHMRYFSGK